MTGWVSVSERWGEMEEGDGKREFNGRCGINHND